MHHDAIIVGGSFAGLAAALQLARARRKVLVIDAGSPRNRFAAHSHGFLGQDGRTPFDILSTARSQLSAYPTATMIGGEAIDAKPAGRSFAVRLANGEEFTADRLILTVGVRDTLPAVEGLQAEWGRSVFHCPYCDGYEIGGGAIGVLAASPAAVHQATLVADWGQVTLFTSDAFALSDDDRAVLERRGVAVEQAPVSRWSRDAAGQPGMDMADGRRIPLRGLFTATRVGIGSSIAERLGCATADGMLGPYIRVDDLQQTTVPGVFAAGDAARQMHSVTFAVSTGAMAGICAHRSMVFDMAA